MRQKKQELATIELARATPEGVAKPQGVGEVAATLVGEFILFVSSDPDENPSNPLENVDGVGTIRSFGRKHRNPMSVGEALDLMKEDADVVPLSYHEHGTCVWSVADGVPTDDFDSVGFAGVWIPDESVRESVPKDAREGDARRAWFREQAKQACTMYTFYCNGDVHDVRVRAFRARRQGERVYDRPSDYRFEEPLSEHKAHGILGWTDVEQAMDELASDALDDLRAAVTA